MGENIDEIFVKRGGNFTIKLESNPSTGYSWHPIYDEEYVKLISNDFMQMTKLMGSGGLERFVFQSVKSGSSNIEMVYKRAWEKKAIKSRRISVNIT
jgi:inhibitor of cysteine peptidase